VCAPSALIYNRDCIPGADGLLMSRPRGSVGHPACSVRPLGVDTVRAYLMFIGPWDSGGPWNPKGIEGVHRFLHRVWHLVVDPAPQVPAAAEGEAAAGVRRVIHQTLKRVTEDLEGFRFNTALAAMMECTNALMRSREIGAGATREWRPALRTLALMLAPFAPHLAE